MRLRENISAKKGGPCGRPFLICLLGVMLAATPLVTPSFAQENKELKIVQRPDEELVLLSVRIGRRLVAESISAYADKTSLMLPLGQLSSVLQFPINVSSTEGQADGWFLDTENNFTLDVARRETIIAGSRGSFEPSQVEAHQDDIYVDSKLLAKWFPVEFDFSFSEQMLTVTAQKGTLLPVQEIEERKEAQTLLEGSQQEEDTTPLQRIYSPYQFATIPYTDITYSTGYDKQVRNGTYNELSLLATGDLFYMNSRVYASADQDEDLVDLRWTLSRRDPDGNILQPDEKLGNTYLGQALRDLEVREVAFGDINTPQLPLTAVSQQGRGALISNIPYDRATRYDRTTLQGDILPGWEVELYRNDELLFFQRASNNGRYEFQDVPLLSGLNIIRLVFYGPFGQKREEVQRFRVTPDLIRQGKSYFRLAASQQDTSIFDIQKRNRIGFSVVNATPIQAELVRGRQRSMFEYEYGLLNNLSLFANASTFTTPDNEQRDFGSAGFATTLAGIYARADYARDFGHDGNAYSLLLQDTLGGVSLSAETQHYRNFISDYTENVNDPLEDSTLLRADTPVNLFGWRLNAGVDGARKKYESGRLIHEIGSRLATSISTLALSHNLTYRRDTSPGATQFIVSPTTGLPVVTRFYDKQLRGQLITSLPFYRNALLRGNLSYNLQPQRELESAGLSAEYRFTNNTNATFQIDRVLLAPTLTTYTLGVNHRFEHFLLGGRASHNDDGENALGAVISLSFGPDPRTGGIQSFPEYSATDGIISAKAYQDFNGNGRYDYSDEPLENTQFLVNRGNGNERTNESGNVTIRNLQADVHNRVTLDESSLESPYLIAGTKGYDVVPRPGVPMVVNYPVTAAGDVEGTIYLHDQAGNRKEAANVAMQLVDERGIVIKEARTAYDGYYLMDLVPSGNYTLRIAPEQAERLGIATDETRQIAIGTQVDNVVIADLSIYNVTSDGAPSVMVAQDGAQPESTSETADAKTEIIPPGETRQGIAAAVTPVLTDDPASQTQAASAPVAAPAEEQTLADATPPAAVSIPVPPPAVHRVSPSVAGITDPATSKTMRLATLAQSKPIQVATQKPLPADSMATVPDEWNW